MSNNIEVEYKFPVLDKEPLTSILDDIALSKIGRQYQSNTMFDNPSKIMQISDARIRVRTLGDTGYKILTYKKPLQPLDGAKREVEYEISFEDTQGMIENILAAMEFTSTTSYERYQTRWELKGVHVTLDEYPHTTVIEIEGDKELIDSVANKLGFNISQSLTKPIDTLFQEWRESQGLSFKPHMRFNDFNK